MDRSIVGNLKRRTRKMQNFRFFQSLGIERIKSSTEQVELPNTTPHQPNEKLVCTFLVVALNGNTFVALFCVWLGF